MKRYSSIILLLDIVLFIQGILFYSQKQLNNLNLHKKFLWQMRFSFLSSFINVKFEEIITFMN